MKLGENKRNQAQETSASPKVALVKKYQPESVDDHYDVIIIGSGIGGMSCGAYLARSGRKVLLLEKHYTPGGFTHVFRRKGFSWDVGLHYIGEVHRDHSFLKLLFDDLSDDQLRWQSMGDVYDTALFPDGGRFDFHAGREAFIETMTGYFPQERQAIERYVGLIYQAARAAQPFFSHRALPRWSATFAAPFMTSKFKKFAAKTVAEVLDRLTDNAKLKAVLTTQWGDYGLPPQQASFAIHAMVVKHYMAGGAYPIGGSKQIADTILPAIADHGGHIRTRAAVEQILLRDGKAVGVRMKGGHEIHADLVISNAGVHNTYGPLLSEFTPAQTPSAIQHLPASASHICLYLGLKGSSAALDLPRANQWIFPGGYDHDANVQNFFADPQAPFPIVYISFPSAKDPEWAQTHPETSTVEIVSVMDFKQVRPWQDTKWYQRGDDYLAYKQQVAERLMQTAYQYNPKIKGQIEVMEVSSPLTTRHFCGYPQGEIYGLDHSPDRFMKTIRPQTPIKNLYLTGQDVVTAGVGGALMGGLLTASAVLKKNLAKDIIARRRT